MRVHRVRRSRAEEERQAIQEHVLPDWPSFLLGAVVTAIIVVTKQVESLYRIADLKKSGRNKDIEAGEKLLSMSREFGFPISSLSKGDQKLVDRFLAAKKGSHKESTSLRESSQAGPDDFSTRTVRGIVKGARSFAEAIPKTKRSASIRRKLEQRLDTLQDLADKIDEANRSR